MNGSRITRIAAGTLAAASAVLALTLGEAGGRTVWSGVYTKAQADRGAEAYAAHCEACHGAELTGVGEAKPLSGAGFLSNWNGLSVGDLFERIRTSMPQDAPKSLSREAYADILAYMLRFNGFPAGASELPARTESLTDIRFDAFGGAAALGPTGARAETSPGVDHNAGPDPYVADPSFLKPPPGRTMGSTSAVAIDSRGHIWVADRCGANSCADSRLDPIMEFDAGGRFIKAFGRGMFLFPHGLFIDRQDHLWLTDDQSNGSRGAQVFEFDESGKLMRTLGKAGVAKVGPDTFVEPNAVLVAPDGTIFVADGHTQKKDPARIVKFAPDGRFLMQWGVRGPAPGQLEVPHALAMDSKGRLFVGDRWNNRVSIFDQNGEFIAAWTQFGRPSGVYIDHNDVLYVSDSESREPIGYGHHPGWKRGIRVGDARTGKVEAYIPDTYAEPDKTATSGAEGIWADNNGVIYGAQVEQKAVVRYTKKSAAAP